MLHFALNYGEILKHHNEQTRIAQSEFHEKIKQLTGNDLMDAFVEQKRTGVERPSMSSLSLTQIISFSSSSFLTFFIE